jgi:hypothetical protein
MMSSFIEHGSVNLHIEDRILRVQGNGPWNLEALVEAQNRYGSLVETLHGNPWGTLIVLSGDPIYIPQAADYLVNSIQYQRSKGCVASAILVAQSSSPEFAKRHLSELHTRAEDTFRFFANTNDAAWWLLQQITSQELT